MNSKEASLLAGDVGGTKCNLVWVQGDHAQEASIPSQSSDSLEAILDRFLEGRSPDAIGLGLAGPVLEGRCHLTNLGWELSQDEMSQRYGCPVGLTNDLAANALGLEALPESQFASLQGEPNGRGPRAMISAGTGLGMCWIPQVQGAWYPHPSEAGHCDFAPGTPLELELHAWVTQRLGRATWEHVLSGPGMGNLYAFFLERAGVEDPLPKSEDRNAEIARRGLTGEDAIARQALETFVDLYASAAANLALSSLPTGGLFLGGGIAPKILTALKEPRFLQRFLAKAPMHSLLEKIPVSVVLEPKTALLGAKILARRQLG